jgi:hypothetical protein
VLERRKYRDAVLQRLLERAYREAASHKLTERCQRAMYVTGTSPQAARQMHAMCKGEELGNDGCLCMCHDDDRAGTVESGMGESVRDQPGFPGRA